MFCFNLSTLYKHLILGSLVLVDLIGLAMQMMRNGSNGIFDGGSPRLSWDYGIRINFPMFRSPASGSSGGQDVNQSF